MRRAAGLRNSLSESVIKSQNSYPSVLAAVASAVSSNKTFKIFYSTRYCEINHLLSFWNNLFLFFYLTEEHINSPALEFIVLTFHLSSILGQALW